MAFANGCNFWHEQRKVITLKDKGHNIPQYVCINNSNKHLAMYMVDGGLIANNGAKCDFLLLVCENKYAYFIELKGSDIVHAVEQIDKSVDLLVKGLSGFAIHGRIVLTRVNTTGLLNIKCLRLENKLKSFGGDLKKQTRKMTESI
jgi:hypothetical protein